MSVKNKIALVQDTFKRGKEKATTTEKLGFEGRKEGISSHAVVIMSKQNA